MDVKNGLYRRLLTATVTVLMAAGWGAPVQAQMNGAFDRAFSEILETRIRLTPGPHGNHFIPAAQLASNTLAPALNALIAENILSTPIPATVPTTTFRMRSGRPVQRTNSLGPIFAEQAETIGAGRFTLGASVSTLSLGTIRGMPLQDIAFAFTHIDATGDGTLGDHPAESDVIMTSLDMDLNAVVSAMVATFGITNALDVALTVPWINISLDGSANATVTSYTLDNLGIAVHRFSEDDRNPQLSTSVPITESASGIGDVSLRLKYSFLRRFNMHAATLVEIKLPTGDEANFMGTGKAGIRLMFATEQRLGGFSHHVSVGYNRRPAALHEDKIEFIAGFEQRFFEGLNFSFDVLGVLSANPKQPFVFPESTMIFDRINGSIVERPLQLSNIPNRDHDNRVDASAGFRFAPSEMIAFLANIVVPLNDAGLRSSIMPTFGFSIGF